MTTPYWDPLVGPIYPSLGHDARCDVLVVGAGITGLSTAYQLARAGAEVIVIDAGPVGAGESLRTTGHLSYVLDQGYSRLITVHGEAAAKLAAESHAVAIKRIHSISREEGIECAYDNVDGWLFPSPGEDPALMAEEFAACHSVGLTQVELVDRLPKGAFNAGPCLRFPEQAQFDPGRYLEGLANAVVRRGGRIFTRTRMLALERGATVTVLLEGGCRIKTKTLVLASNNPFIDRITLQTKLEEYRTYAIAARIPPGFVPKGLYWDTAAPYHYVRLSGRDGDPQVLIVGGEDHRTGQADDGGQRLARLESWMRGHFPMAQEVISRWSGQVVESVDGLAFIGHNPGDDPNILVATGHSGNGLTYGAIAGILLGDIVEGRPNRWAEVYDPSRVRALSAVEWALRSVNAGLQYTHWLQLGRKRAPGQILPGSGAVLQSGGEPTAAYRDEQGGLHQRCAVCPHAGGIVSWNSTEKSWDCPVHGARFGPEGRALNGPAPSDLGPARPSRRRAKAARRKARQALRLRSGQGATHVRHQP